MKRLLALVLVMLLVVAPMASFADETPLESKVKTDGNIPKNLTLTNKDRLNPAEVFEFKFTAVETADGTGPSIPNVQISYDAGESGLKTGAIDLSGFEGEEYRPGRYQYTVEEIVGNTAGMTYTARTATLIVDKESDGKVKSYLIIGQMGDETQKYDDFDNAFAAGNLAITKTVTGNLGDKNKEFEITVTFTAPEGKTVKFDKIYYVKGEEQVPLTSFEPITLNIKHGETITFHNLPEGVTYTVVETANDHDQSITNANGTINGDQEVGITNHKSSEVPTGILLDNLPYIIMLAIAVAGLVFLVMRKRAEEL